ncbi:hypothetical protein CYMTET_52094 [Cymbomonas tetramitiformis]|uniref:Exostosin GT47 domain-containing protein n=1 Tax=Cymbomonas tetramitiformis TaxID=36881 RepID=A0AAE0ET36_9CHLO|nr:hypothetical protein CYMTET_52094 [Cymbomonas tetramitiformis]
MVCTGGLGVAVSSYRSQDYVNTWKDIIMPGVSDSSLVKGTWKPMGKRKHLIFFRGKLHSKDTDPQGHEVKRPLELRQALARDLGKKTRGEILVTDAVTNSASYAEEMRDSVFCLCPRGGTPWTRRVFDALLTGCIPVVISDDIEFPFEDFLPYDKFTIKLSEEQVVKRQDYVESTLREIPQASLEQKLEQIREVREVFLYDKGHALNGILWQLHRKKRRFTHSSTNFWT